MFFPPNPAASSKPQSSGTAQPSIEEIGQACLLMMKRRAWMAAAASIIPRRQGASLMTDVAALMSVIDETNARFGLREEDIQTNDGYQPDVRIRDRDPSLLVPVRLRILGHRAHTIGARRQARRRAHDEAEVEALVRSRQGEPLGRYGRPARGKFQAHRTARAIACTVQQGHGEGFVARCCRSAARAVLLA